MSQLGNISDCICLWVGAHLQNRRCIVMMERNKLGQSFGRVQSSYLLVCRSRWAWSLWYCGIISQHGQGVEQASPVGVLVAVHLCHLALPSPCVCATVAAHGLESVFLHMTVLPQTGPGYGWAEARDLRAWAPGSWEGLWSDQIWVPAQCSFSWQGDLQWVIRIVC